MSEGGRDSSGKRLPFSRSPRSRQQAYPQHQQHQQHQQSSAAAHQMSGYMVHQHPMHPPGHGAGYPSPPSHQYSVYPPNQPPPQHSYHQHPGQGQPPLHLQQAHYHPPPPHQTQTSNFQSQSQQYHHSPQQYHHHPRHTQHPHNPQYPQQQMEVDPYLPASQHLQPILPAVTTLQPRVGRLPADRPIMKLSVSLIETYKEINKVYYEQKEQRRNAKAAHKKNQQTQQQHGPGPQNDGWDDENYDYILTAGELINNRYVIENRIGKGSFGQVVRALDKETNKEVAIKIIKSKKPFFVQAKTEIKLLSRLAEKDRDDENNIVHLLEHFMYRNHTCLVFEMLSLNLYELLKNTRYAGVSLSLNRKFAKQILKGLAFLARPDINIIHCDLKPENILLRSPKRSGVKIIDFGSSCESEKRMYTYIQSRFYRSPEVILGLPYTVAIDMWSLGCILVEMHTGEPLFSGTDVFDQMQKIVAILGMPPDDLINRADEEHQNQFFQRKDGRWTIKQLADATPSSFVHPSKNPTASLKKAVVEGISRKKYPTAAYDRFVDLISSMLIYQPSQRIKPDRALQHPFITSQEGMGPAKSPSAGAR